MTANLEELVLKCLEENAKSGIQEAIRCYNSGAYRASIVSAYVTVCFDLIEKLKSLAATGDGEAKLAEQKLQGLQDQYDKGDPQSIKGLLEFERGLLELFRDKFDFFGKHEFDDLSRLRDDRNRCAHPTFFKSTIPFSPSAELARLHIRNVLTHVLTQNPKQGRSALDSLESLIVSSYFPIDIKEAVIRLKGSELNNARPELIRAFTDKIFFGMADKSSKLYRSGKGRVALEAAAELYRPVVIPRLVVNINKLLRLPEDDAIYVGSVFALRLIDAGEQVDDAGRTVVRLWIKSPPENIVKGNLYCRGLQLSWAKEATLAALRSSGPEELASITLSDIPREVTAFAAELYSAVQSLSMATHYSKKFAVKFAPHFNDDELEVIFREAGEGRANLPGSNGFDEFIKALCAVDDQKSLKVIKLLQRHGLKKYIPETKSIEDAQAV